MLLLIQAGRAFARNIPAIVPNISFLGLDLSLIPLSDEDRFDAISTMFLQQKRLFTMRFGPIMLLGTCHPELMHVLLTHPDCLEKPFLYDVAGYENGLFSAKYNLWKSQRKALNPTFNSKILNSFVSIFESCCRQLVSNLSQCEDGGTVNILDYTSKCTLEMVCSTTLGSENLQKDGKNAFLHGVEQIFDFISRRMLNIHHYPELLYRMTSTCQEDRAARKVCKEFVEKIIKDKRDQASQSAEPEDVDTQEEHFRKPQLFIDQLLSISQIDRKFSDVEILDNIFTIMAAGNDTSGLEVAHACLLLAMHPEIQEKVFSEVASFFPVEEEEEINADYLKRFEYTEMFLKECLRFCPVAPHVARKNLVPIDLDGVTIPAGNVFVCSIYALHRRQDFWGPHAELFNPENFNLEHCKARHPAAFMPFSTGTRSCIGGRYAMISMKLMILHIVRNFKLSTHLKTSDLRFRFGITLRPSFKHLIRIEKRTNHA
ncbi:cytochrome P450 4c21-like [Malaya genurostris]|uniref:cytochrome P450 4c21-like n=1 Tax=Malaya genurostris TaxID=325434 RepID=UPI0026F3E6A8|nr:cytochrome P450 4c21-like [Malaya genurostris]